MIKKLQIRFITLSAAAVLIVMSAAIGLFNMSNFIVQKQRIDEMLFLYGKHKDDLHKNFTSQKELVRFFILN